MSCQIRQKRCIRNLEKQRGPEDQEETANAREGAIHSRWTAGDCHCFVVRPRLYLTSAVINSLTMVGVPVYGHTCRLLTGAPWQMQDLEGESDERCEGEGEREKHKTNKCYW